MERDLLLGVVGEVGLPSGRLHRMGHWRPSTHAEKRREWATRRHQPFGPAPYPGRRDDDLRLGTAEARQLRVARAPERDLKADGANGHDLQQAVLTAAFPVVGGVDVARQLLHVGLVPVDELRVDVMPVLLGAGLWFFESRDPDRIQLKKIAAQDGGAPAEPSLRFRVKKWTHQRRRWPRKCRGSSVGQRPSICNRLDDLLAAWLRARGATVPMAPPEQSADTAQVLQLRTPRPTGWTGPGNTAPSVRSR